jgi:hypothetical protein
MSQEGLRVLTSRNILRSSLKGCLPQSSCFFAGAEMRLNYLRGTAAAAARLQICDYCFDEADIIDSLPPPRLVVQDVEFVPVHAGRVWSRL